jgi:predicted kinase
MPATLILVTGLPASGKSHLAQLLSDDLGIALISKDGIKEVLFDTVGVRDREWSKKLGRATFSLLDYVTEEQLKAGNSIILESPLNPEFENNKFQQWQKDYGFKAVQIICQADGNVLFERFKVRASAGGRHAGHQDAENLDEFEQILHSPTGEQRIDIDSVILTINTTDFEKVDYRAILKEVGAIVKSK